MATNDLSTKAKICDAALALLRQDIGYSSSTTIAAKCDNLWGVAWDAVATAHKWSSNMSAVPSDTPPTSTLLRSLLVYSMAHELAIPITGRQEDLKTIDALFRDKLVKAYVSDLNSQIHSLSGDQKDIAAELVTIISEGGKEIPYSIESFTDKISAVTTECQNEVRNTLGLSANDTIDAMAQALVKHLALAKLGTSCGFDANFVQAHMTSYASKVNEWRKLKLNDALKNSSDEVLLRVLGNFKNDDTGLVNAFDIYNSRGTAAKDIAEKEIKNVHNWSATFSKTTTTHVAYPAFVELASYKILLSCSGDPNFVQLGKQEYEKRIQEAITKDLEDEMHALRASNNEDDKFAVQVLDVFRQYFSVADGQNSYGNMKAQPRGIAVLVEHLNSIKDNIRKEVLLTHDWSFAKREMKATSYNMVDGRYQTMVPPDSVKVVRCFGIRGNKLEAVIREGDKIVTNEQVDRIVYLCDDGGTLYWPPLVVKAYIYKCVEALCMASPEMSGNQAKIQLIEAVVNNSVNEARKTDTRQSAVGTSAYGRNYLLDVATGRVNPKRFGR